MILSLLYRTHEFFERKCVRMVQADYVSMKAGTGRKSGFWFKICSKIEHKLSKMIDKRRSAQKAN